MNKICTSSLFLCGKCDKPVELISMDFCLESHKTTYVLRCHDKLETKTLTESDLAEVKRHGKKAWIGVF